VPPFDIVRVMRPLTRGGWQQRSSGRGDDMIELLSMPLEGEWIPPLTERAR
ncbi:MAG: hypothetical protein HYU66_24270, partial [Armatimonadetes bacterium]|nr:hypothetical protein [Armatimonadota bacterium]